MKQRTLIGQFLEADRELALLAALIWERMPRIGWLDPIFVDLKWMAINRAKRSHRQIGRAHV